MACSAILFLSYVPVFFTCTFLLAFIQTFVKFILSCAWTQFIFWFETLLAYSIFILQSSFKLFLWVLSSGCTRYTSPNLYLTALPCIIHFLVLVPSSITLFFFCLNTWYSSMLFFTQSVSKSCPVSHYEMTVRIFKSVIWHLYVKIKHIMQNS